MAPQESTVLRTISQATPLYRTAPHNIELEQALLGAILVNNDAFRHVSNFLDPPHFFEPVHQEIFQIARTLISAGTVATPVNLKTFLPPDLKISGLTAGQATARPRRDLIKIGEEIVNGAYDAAVEASPQDQIEAAERRLYELGMGSREK